MFYVITAAAFLKHRFGFGIYYFLYIFSIPYPVQHSHCLICNIHLAIADCSDTWFKNMKPYQNHQNLLYRSRQVLCIRLPKPSGKSDRNIFIGTYKCIRYHTDTIKMIKRIYTCIYFIILLKNPFCPVLFRIHAAHLHMHAVWIYFHSLQPDHQHN